jgi:fructokinase
MVSESEILCVGEVLWDALPAGLFLGGAPFNVACHLRAAGWRVTMVSRVGEDRLGEEVLRRAPWYGVGADLIQVDPELPTGLVRATLDEAGNAEYEILEPAAWDAIALDAELVVRAEAARAIVYGTVAQRNATTRATIERLWESDALMVFDANLRPPYDRRDVVEQSLNHANVVKVTERELERLAEWFRLPTGLRPSAAALAETFNCETVCVTRGRSGAALWRNGDWTEEPGYEVEVRDTVGAGDAFLALLLAGLLDGADDRVTLRHANLIGAYVATQLGAVPLDQPSAVAPPLPAGLPRRRKGKG